MKNNKNKFGSMVCGLLLVAAGGVLAGEPYYGGNVSFIDYSEDGFEDASLSVVSGRLGASWNENFSGELRVGFGIGDDTVSGVNLELESFFGAYLKAAVPMTEVISPYVILGYTRGEVEASYSGLNLNETESDVSFGLGVDFNVSESVTLNLEYMDYLDKGITEVGGVTLGISSSF